MRSFISLEEAINILNEKIDFLGVEEVDLLKGLGRVTSESVYSTINNPPFNKSAMDGYAIKSEDGFIDNKIKVIDKVFAGGFSNNTVEKNTAIKIMTGAPMPEGSDAVIKQEDVIKDDDYIIIRKDVKEKENVCIKGEDISVGSLLIKANKKLDYADIGILASAGITKIKVFRKPKIGFISTGDEVMDVGSDLTFGKIYNSNKYSIISRILELGYEVSEVHHINDDYREIGKFIENISKGLDLIITTGGVSVGEKDLLKEAINVTSGEKFFWKITIKPGSAVLCSKVNNSIVISLSGNPTAALTTFELLAKNSLEKLSGLGEIKIKREEAILKEGIIKKGFKHRFLRGFYKIENSKQYVYVTQKKSGNGILSSAINSNCIIEINANDDEKLTGDIVNIIKL